jgi:GH24 family phage-related lysozyme (muramidase)
LEPTLSRLSWIATTTVLAGLTGCANLWVASEPAAAMVGAANPATAAVREPAPSVVTSPPPPMGTGPGAAITGSASSSGSGSTTAAPQSGSGSPPATLSASARLSDTVAVNAGEPFGVSQGERKAARFWTTHDAALQIIKDAEAPDGPRLKAYAEGTRWFIGYGHAGATRGQIINRARAEELLRQDVHKCEQALAQAVKVSITHNEFSAMVSLCHNIGSTRFRKSQVVARLNSDQRSQAAQAFNEWTKPISLALRRRREITLFTR